MSLAFGPVPSRRLGSSLGVNNIPAKICSYSCVYCQLGKTTKLSIERKAFYDPNKIFKVVKDRVNEILSVGGKIDYITFVPDGEPTLDVNLGKEIMMLKTLKIPIAVLTNASLLWREDVRNDLINADLVSIKIDAISEKLWRRINRPHARLKLEEILEGIIEFSRDFKGKIISETMLVDCIDYTEELEKIANFLRNIKLDKAYIAVPIRPPAESWAKPPKENVINMAYQIFSKKLGKDRVELLIGYSQGTYGYTNNIERDLLSILSVHPMREEEIKEYLRRTNADWRLIEKLIKEEKIIRISYQGKIYYMKKFSNYC